MKITRNKNSKWVIDFTCKGRRIRRVIGYSKEEAKDAMASLRRQIRSEAISEKNGLIRSKKRILFEDFAKEFLEIYSKQNKKSWKRDEFSLLNLISFFKNRCLADITPDLIEKFKAKRREKVSPSTVNRELACLKTLFSKAVEWEKTESNPVNHVEKLLRRKQKENK